MYPHLSKHKASCDFEKVFGLKNSVLKTFFKKRRLDIMCLYTQYRTFASDLLLNIYFGYVFS